MIPVYADINSLKPNPNENLEWAEKAYGKKTLKEWEKSMKKGYKKEKIMLVDWRGAIIDGNVRYYLAKKLDIQYLPIDFNFLKSDLDSFVKTMGYKWAELLKLESEEMKELEARIEELRPNLRRTTEKEKLEIVTQLVETILTKREK